MALIETPIMGIISIVVTVADMIGIVIYLRRLYD
jgi:hypothetical protein